jgi:predicted CXXCH cytochrome family protein
MKRKSVFGFLSLAVVGAIGAGPAFAAISGSRHDFSSNSWNTTGQICAVCHTPHNAGSTSAPLWAHALTTATFTLYSSSSLNATAAQPSASSKACLSCHDGTVALDSFGGRTGTTFIPQGTSRFGTDLSNDHPVSIAYDASLATTDGTLYDPTTKTVTALGGRTVDAAMLIGHKVECGSCHDVHKSKGYAPSSADMLLVNNAGSSLCFTCHNK